ncbi:hypothetical protein DCS_03451 [Drechmeria coniospora]|uniref:Vacuolar H+/Ca2+ exchanger n=1 Tax=Drechmeria coniospora TaxID=98403 RepID=A0A151GHC8_DRECN|nr:hypothetical protein DCS_03451 [Drechmeria coniospora]KYK56451.1 hypothetical protein DCS_03451 [Drechmeria coniospora]
MDTQARDQAETLLLHAASAYGLRVGRHDVRRALVADSGAELATWAATHLVPETLLTVDELKLYTKLDKNGDVDRLAALHSLEEVQAVNEDDLTVAIHELERSTRSIMDQTERLGRQQESLRRIVATRSESEGRRCELEQARRQILEAENRQLADEVDGLSRSLDLRLSYLERQAIDAGPVLEQAISDALQSDDELLVRLQRRAQELDQSDVDDAQSMVDKLRDGCTRLINLTAEAIHIKMDTAYLDALMTTEESPEMDAAVTVDKAEALRQEIESLYSEILPVAQMSIHQQHLEPAMELVKERKGQSLDRTAAALTFMNDALDHLQGRLHSLGRRAEAHVSHQVACSALTSAARAEMTTSIEGAKQASVIRNPSPIRMQMHPADSRSRRRSSGVPEEPPLEALYRQLALSATLYEGDGKQQRATLAKALKLRTKKSVDVSHATQESFESSTMTHVRDAKRAIQLLHDSLLAETPFGLVHLADPGIESSISVLEQEVNKARGRVEAVDGQKSTAMSEKRRQFIDRWGS